MKNIIVKFSYSVAILMLLLGVSCSTFDDSISYNTPVNSQNTTRVRVISGELSGRKFTVKVEGKVVATNVEYGKMTSYIEVPFEAKNYELIDESTKESLKFDVTNIAVGSFINFREKGLRKGFNYTFVIYNPVNSSEDGSLYKDKVVLKIVIDDKKNGSLVASDLSNARIRPLLILDVFYKAYVFEGITTEDKVFDGRVNPLKNKLDFHASVGYFLDFTSANDKGDGIYTSLGTDEPEFKYFTLKNSTKTRRFEGVRLKRDNSYTIVVSGRGDNDSSNPLKVTLYNDASDESPIVLKQIGFTDNSRIARNSIFNLAYNLAEYGYIDAVSNWPGDTGNFRGINFNATLPNTDVSYNFGSDILYPDYAATASEKRLSSARLKELQNSTFTYSLSPILNGGSVNKPFTTNIDLKVPAGNSFNFYVATDNNKKTVLIVLPNPDFPTTDSKILRVVDMVPDLTGLKVELITPTKTITLGENLTFGSQTNFSLIDAIEEECTIRVSDSFGNIIAQKDNVPYALNNTITLSGTATTDDDISNPNAVLRISAFGLL
jgi:hypothetical protein